MKSATKTQRAKRAPAQSAKLATTSSVNSYRQNPTINDESSSGRPPMVIKISSSMVDQVFRCPKALLKAQRARTVPDPKIADDGCGTYPSPSLDTPAPPPLSRSISCLCDVGINMEKKRRKKKIEVVRMDEDDYYL
ncbi:uncharacterized protein A4U43_C04F30990 [Asparagus officinalis]|uniref:Uncharacterized protein n=1 Tax=Asparagus officinalis TaxID=4686 RepID=A0A5P1FA39_ASPOF|nr:uncharacterized protein A4U43_C04F30990 [Asparagus officinalis]